MRDERLADDAPPLHVCLDSLVRLPQLRLDGEAGIARQMVDALKRRQCAEHVEFGVAEAPEQVPLVAAQLLFVPIRAAGAALHKPAQLQPPQQRLEVVPVFRDQLKSRSAHSLVQHVAQSRQLAVVAA
jgi:hypothetical protein